MIKKKGNADVFLIQETKVVNMDGSMAKRFWSSPKVGFSYSNSLGRSGVLLILWNDKVEVLNTFKGEGYMGIKIWWEKNSYYVVNVYSSCVLNKKIAL